MNLAVYVHPGWGQLPVALKWLSLQLVCNTVITQLAKSDSVWFYSACKLKSSTPRVTKSAGQSLLVFHLRHFSKVKNVFLSCFHIVMERKEIYFKGSVSTAGSRFFFKKKKPKFHKNGEQQRPLSWRVALTGLCFYTLHDLTGRLAVQRRGKGERKQALLLLFLPIPPPSKELPGRREAQQIAAIPEKKPSSLNSFPKSYQPLRLK